MIVLLGIEPPLVTGYGEWLQSPSRLRPRGPSSPTARSPLLGAAVWQTRLILNLGDDTATTTSRHCPGATSRLKPIFPDLPSRRNGRRHLTA